MLLENRFLPLNMCTAYMCSESLQNTAVSCLPEGFTQWHGTLPSKYLFRSSVQGCKLLTKCLFGVAGSHEPHCAHQWVFPYRRREGFCASMAFFSWKRDVLLEKAALDKKTNQKSTSFEASWLKSTFLNDKQAVLQFIPQSQMPFPILPSVCVCVYNRISQSWWVCSISEAFLNTLLCTLQCSHLSEQKYVWAFI